MEPGAAFELKVFEDFQKEGIYISKIKTRSTQFKGDNEIADFYIYDGGKLIYLEAKSTKGDRFPFSMIQPNQAVGINSATKFEGVYGGIILEMRMFDMYYFIPIQAIDYILSIGKVSMNIDDLHKLAYQITNIDRLGLYEFGKHVKIHSDRVPKRDIKQKEKAK